MTKAECTSFPRPVFSGTRLTGSRTSETALSLFLIIVLSHIVFIADYARSEELREVGLHRSQESTSRPRPSDPGSLDPQGLWSTDPGRDLSVPGSLGLLIQQPSDPCVS